MQWLIKGLRQRVNQLQIEENGTADSLGMLNLYFSNRCGFSWMPSDNVWWGEKLAECVDFNLFSTSNAA